MKKISILLNAMLLSLPLVSLAQEFTIKWGPLMNVGKTDYVDDFVYADANQVTITKKNLKTGKFNAIEKYDKNFKLVYAKELTSTDKNTYVVNSGYTGSKILNLLRIYNSSAKTNDYKLSVIDDTPNAKPSIWDIAQIDLSDKKSYSSTSVYYSPDYKTRVYVIEKSSNSLKNASDKEFIVSVANEKGEKLWQKSITNKGVSNYFSEITELAVNNSGEVVLVEKRFNEDNTKRTDLVKVDGEFISGYEYNLYIFTNKGNDYKKVNIDLGAKRIQSLNTEVNPDNGNFQFAGMYSNGKKSVIQGVLFGEIDTQGKVVKSTSKDFSNEFIDQFKKGAVDKEKGDDDEGLSSSFKLRRFLSREDGGAYIVFEYYKMVVTTITTANGTSTKITYYYNDVIVTSVNKEGNIDWNYRIPKYQRGPSYIFSSIVPFVSGNTLGIIYNENPKNLDLNFDDKFKTVNFKESIAIVRTLTPDGKLKSSELFKNKDFETLLQPSMCRQTSPTTIAIYGGKFGMLSIKDARLGVIEIKP